MSHRGLTEGEERRALGEELDIHSVFTWTKYLNQGIDAHFNARIGSGGTEVAAKASTYWSPPQGVLSGSLICPAAIPYVALYSKNTFSSAYFRTLLPTLTVDGQALWMGFENDGGHKGGLASFYLDRAAGVERLRIYFGPAAGDYVVATAALPADNKTVVHVYSIQNLDPWCEFYIDNNLITVMINSPNLAFAAVAYPPYAIYNTSVPNPRKMPCLFELTNQGVDLVHPLNIYGVRLSDAPELPPRVFRMYSVGTTTLLAGLAVNPNVTSHPVPTFGYSTKTLLFRAGGAGTLSVQVLTQANNWREYDSISIAANTLLSYIMMGAAVLVRIVFTPTAPPATITDAEVVLG